MSWKRKILSVQEESKIEQKIALYEKETGAELVICIAKSSDPYPAAVLRFSILATLAISALLTFYFTFSHELILVGSQLILFFLLTFIGRSNHIKRFFLSKLETDREVGEKAMELFYSRGLYQTKYKVGILLFISIQEKMIRLLVDKKLQEKISQDDLDYIVNILGKEFKTGHYFNGLNQTLNILEEKILHFFPEKVQPQDSENEIANKILWADPF